MEDTAKNLMVFRSLARRSVSAPASQYNPFCINFFPFYLQEEDWKTAESDCQQVFEQGIKKFQTGTILLLFKVTSALC